MSKSGEGSACFLQGSGCRMDPGAVCTIRRPPQSCDVRADWLRVCGGCHVRLSKGDGPMLRAAVRGEAQAATPHTSRKRPLPGQQQETIGEEEEGTSAKEADTFRGFAVGVTQVYGEGGMFPNLPAGVKMLIAGAHCTLKRLTDAQEGGPPVLEASDNYATKAVRRTGVGGGRGVITELVAQIFGVSTRTVSRAVAECGWNGKEDVKIREPLAPGPYAITPHGAKLKYERDRLRTVEAYDEMRTSGDSITAPLMALALSDDGDAAAYAPMELGDPSDGEEEHCPEDCADDREVTPAAYFKCYRRMKACGFTWAKAEYDWLKERLTDYNVGWISCYA